MKKEKILENYFASNLYSNQEILQSIENTKKELLKLFKSLIQAIETKLNLKLPGIHFKPEIE